MNYYVFQEMFWNFHNSYSAEQMKLSAPVCKMANVLFSHRFQAMDSETLKNLVLKNLVSVMFKIFYINLIKKVCSTKWCKPLKVSTVNLLEKFRNFLGLSHYYCQTTQIVGSSTGTDWRRKTLKNFRQLFSNENPRTTLC